MNIRIMAAVVFAASASFADTRQAATPAELVQALNDLNGKGVANVIELTADRYDMTGYKMVESGDAFCHLNASKVTIRGRSSNPRDTVVFGDGATRVFCLASARLHDLTVSNGYTSVKYGAGVFCETLWSTTAVCSNCVITCNINTGSGGGVGGAQCEDCEICYNRANHGGGAAYVNLIRGDVHDNTATSSGGAALSAIARGTKVHHNTALRGSGFSDNTAHTSSDCEIYANAATGTGSGDGGAVKCITAGSEMNLVFTNCFIHDNTSAYYGGGAASCKLMDCVVSNNVAICGGGTYDTYAFDTLIVSNRATGVADATKCQGGGAYHGSLVGCTVTNNVADGYGGGQYNGSASNTVYACNEAGKDGGGLFATTATNCVLTGNSAPVGGGAYYSTLRGCLIAGNRATIATGTDSGGGGICSGTAYDCVVSNNFSQARGGGIYGATVYDSRIVMNMSVSHGAGINGGSLSNCVLAGNAAISDGMGGGAYSTTIRDSIIRDNFSRVGSAVHSGSVYGSIITNNASSAGTYTTRCTTCLEDCFICAQQLEAPGAMLNCVVTGGGQPVTIEEGANVYTSGTFATTMSLIVNTQNPMMAATNCLFYGNVGSTLFGGPYNFSDKVLTLVNCTIADNRYDSTFSAVPGQTVGKNGSIVIRNCIFAGNRTQDGKVARDLKPSSTTYDTQVYLSNCLVQEPPVAEWRPLQYENIITNRPLFAAKGEHPYEIKRSSPARGKGIVEAWMANATDIRGAGFARLGEDGLVDLGCYQCWRTPIGFMLFLR